MELIFVIEDILLFHVVLENEEALFKKPLAEITKILYEEVNEKRSDEYSEILISLANQLLEKEEKLAFDLAILSLKGNKPVFNWNSYSFFSELKKKNETLSNQYFAKMLEVVKLSGNRENLEGLLTISFNMFRGAIFPSMQRPQNITETQKRDLLVVLVPFIEKESEELSQKKRDNCALARGYGKRFLEDYRKLLPQRAGVIEQALNICQMSEIDFWKKPDFNRTLKTSQDYLDFAKEVGDKAMRANLILFAASFAAQNEQNYRLAIEILDGMDEDSRKILNINYWWEIQRLQSSSGFIIELFNKGSFAEINQFIKNSPQKLRPFIILHAMNRLRSYSAKNKQMLFDLLNQAKAEFFKIEIPVPTDNSFFNLSSLAQIHLLVSFYYDLGYKTEAIETFEEYINFLNRFERRVSSDNNGERRNLYFYYHQLPKNFIETYFEQIYQNIERIEALPGRLSFRLNLFREILDYQSNSIPISIPAYNPNK